MPKAWFEFDLYYSLIHNSNDDLDVFDMIPKLGSFEVSTVITVGGKQTDVLLFSKMFSNSWPNFVALEQRLRNFISDTKAAQRGENLMTVHELKSKYQTSRRPAKTEPEPVKNETRVSMNTV